MRQVLVLFAITFSVFASTSIATNLKSTRPDRDTILAATSQCSLASVQIPRGIVGISDPNALDPQVIELIAETGVKWVRAEFHWSQIEPIQGGGYRFEAYDAMVDQFNKAGISVQAILTYIPDYLHSDWVAIDTSFQNFVAATVKRYAAQGVHQWEIFNEPNLPGFGWLTKRENARDYLGAYTLLLARANRIIRELDPKGVVLIGGLASDQHRGLPAEETMRVIYDLGAQKCFDVMAFHPYGYQNQFPKARARIDGILTQFGDQNKPIWFNEYGWTDYAEMDRNRNNTVHTNPMMAVFDQRNSADALFWFAAKDYSGRRNAPTFGLATFDLKKRPSFDTFRALVQGIK